MNKLPKKIEKIYELNEAQYNKFKKWITVSLVACGVFLIVVIPMMRFWVEYQPIWKQPFIVQISFAASFITLLIAGLILIKAKPLSFEKKLFMRLFRAYTFFERFTTLTGSGSQDPSDLKNVKKQLTEVSKRLMRKKRKNTTLDLTKEVYDKYGEIGKLIQTKILYLIEKDDVRKGLVQQKILDLLKMFSDPKLGKLDSCIKSINEISETGPFKAKTNFLEDNPRIRSWGSHIVKFLVSAIVVVVVTHVYSYFFSTPISELTSPMIVSTFALFGAWEFKTR